mmetsp:Transcript_67432/g.140900  ORF Transcript_67432/g.140900 Transcript_67432/m.140900 type:complete len:735 (-) Transcript_67432:260-2464(-)|eukprot:CAMPEP_0206442394 /NCGR_PEP_ID=MMETSP0324_2-20121206/13800_1 /ASSEMBLY_ACC=CAM_ASM_000836 /TAXON_ID=2866 /ORGANISM="Crypthecodinium cohnii, Strain Seligo" /LENGTH=734 /DNA_ID=CAMNT_0053910237 /DNA_START=250 /DNA_END=2454 /DNA_ORIENTATION=-
MPTKGRKGHGLVVNGKRNGLAGLLGALGFLLFVQKFNEHVQTYKAMNNISHGSQVDQGLASTMTRILRTTCGKREAVTVIKLCFMLVFRTLGSVWTSRQWGSLVNATVGRNWRYLHKLIGEFAGVTLGLALLNALLKYYIGSLRTQVRESLTTWCHEYYMRPKDMIFYKANRVGAQKIDHCDHQITSDVERFSEIFSDVLSQSLKPIVDFLVYSVELSMVQGIATPLTLYSWFAVASCISTATLPPFGELAAREQELEGTFRGAHSDLIMNCEQIAFSGGDQPEKRVLNRHFRNLIDHCTKSLNLAFKSEVIRQYLNKYFVTVIGLFLLSRPLRLGKAGMKYYTADQIAQYFTSTWRNMEAMATAIQDLFELTNRMGRLSGLASRVQRLMAGIEERPPELKSLIDAAKEGPWPPTYKYGSHLKFEHVSVYKPDGTLLVKDLNFEVTRGMRVLITGPNGCGKSSLFRVIRKLWPLVEGSITMPAEKEIHFLSQVNFVPVGTLRDLVIYPDSVEMMEAEGRTDGDIFDCLEWAHVSPKALADGRADLQFTEEGKVVRPQLDDIRDWQKDLSPGQKQRLAFARLFYHRPSFVVLDECTNGISPDVEHDLYDRCTKLNLAVFSISHKIELKLFHDFELHYTGDLEGSWTWRRCSLTRGPITRSESTVVVPPVPSQSQQILDGNIPRTSSAVIKYERVRDRALQVNGDGDNILEEEKETTNGGLKVDSNGSALAQSDLY